MRCLALTAVLVLGVSLFEAAHADAPAATPPTSDAAAKHAKRTACLKDAKTRKLVGDDKKSYLKSCMAGS